MRFMARMLAVCVAMGIMIVAAYAASFTLDNRCNEAFTVVLNYTDNSSESVWLNASSLQPMDVGVKSVSSVTINGYTVQSGLSGYPVFLPSGTRIYISVSSHQVVASNVPID